MQTAFRIGPNELDAHAVARSVQVPAIDARDEAQSSLKVRGLFVLCGFSFGVLVGEAFLGGAFPAALVGAVAGMLVEFLASRD